MRRAAKRSFDVCVALTGLIVLAPLILVLCVLIRTRLGSPILFRQQRTGRRSASFQVMKFRTMNSKSDEYGRLLPDHLRLTRLGGLLRKLSLDEIPQLINVLRGDMSLIGPRPLLPKYDAWYTTWERRRFSVRPGITGLAQVAGRNTVRWNDRLALDVEYVDRWSIAMDVRIFAQTVKAIFVREGVVEDPRSLMLDLDVERSQAGTMVMADLQTEVRELLRVS